MAFTDWTCETCDAEGRRGYCCPGRCYCGHESCHAFASWTPRPDLSNVIVLGSKTQRRERMRLLRLPSLPYPKPESLTPQRDSDVLVGQEGVSE